MKRGKYISVAAGFLALVLLLTGCHDKRDPGLEYAPNMYHSIPAEPYTQEEYSPIFGDGNAQYAPEKTIARGNLWQYYGNFPDAYEPNDTIKIDSMRILAQKNLTNPLPITQAVLDSGKIFYDRFCAICHGTKGKGDGNITKNTDKYPVVPTDFTSEVFKTRNDGYIYHVITYGKNLMGSYASQVTPRERWMIAHYVMNLKGERTVGGDIPVAPADTMNVEDADAAPMNGEANATASDTTQTH